MIIEYALLAMKNLNIPEIIGSAVYLIEDHKLILGAAFLFLIFFVIGKKW